MTRGLAETLGAVALILSLLNPVAATPYVFGHTPLFLAVLAAGVGLGSILKHFEEKI